MKTEMCVCLGSTQPGGGGSTAGQPLWLRDEDAEAWDVGSPPGSQASEDNPRRRGR